MQLSSGGSEHLLTSLAVYHHVPADYLCPLCILAAGSDNPTPHGAQSDLVFRTQHVTAFIGAQP